MIFLLTAILIAVTWIPTALGQRSPIENETQPWNHQSSTHNEPDNDGQSRFQGGRTGADIPVSTSTATDQPANNQNATKNHPQGHWPIGSGGLMVILTFGYVAVAFFTLRAIKRQADLAANQLRMILGVERPWVLAYVAETMQPQIIETATGTEMGLVTRCVIENFGKTPAWITSWGAKRINVFPNALPPVPDYKGFNSVEQVLPPGKHLDTSLVWTTSHIDQAHNDKLFLYIFGIATYRDGFGGTQTSGIEHETRFCFRYYPPLRDNRAQGFHVGGPPQYNRQT